MYLAGEEIAERITNGRRYKSSVPCTTGRRRKRLSDRGLLLFCNQSVNLGTQRGGLSSEFRMCGSTLKMKAAKDEKREGKHRFWEEGATSVVPWKNNEERSQQEMRGRTSWKELKTIQTATATAVKS